MIPVICVTIIQTYIQYIHTIKSHDMKEQLKNRYVLLLKANLVAETQKHPGQMQG